MNPSRFPITKSSGAWTFKCVKTILYHPKMWILALMISSKHYPIIADQVLWQANELLFIVWTFLYIKVINFVLWKRRSFLRLTKLAYLEVTEEMFYVATSWPVFVFNKFCICSYVYNYWMAKLANFVCNRCVLLCCFKKIVFLQYPIWRVRQYMHCRSGH